MATRRKESEGERLRGGRRGRRINGNKNEERNQKQNEESRERESMEEYDVYYQTLLVKLPFSNLRSMNF
jgi:hypothetical protein